MAARTFYIETDEEIISVIARLRKSSAERNIFVFPKHALVMQSIVNLRLFQREAEKLGKKIVVVCQDEAARKLAEKAGVVTENYSEDLKRRESHLEILPTAAEAKGAAGTPEQTPVVAIRADAIGSSDFYAANDTPLAPGSAESPAPPSAKTTLRVRNASPEKIASLNSMRQSGSPAAAPATIQSTPLPLTTPPSLPTTSVSGQVSAAGRAGMERVGQNSSPSGEYGERLKNFYQSSPAPVPAYKSKTPQSAGAPSPAKVTGHKARMIFFVLGGISLLSVVGVLVFFLLPKAEVYVTPYKITQPAETEMTGGPDGASSAAGNIRFIERDFEITLTRSATGKAGSANQKARGTAVFSNNYSTEPQSLVATTRLETPDGKLFRLVKGITIPGMTIVDGQKKPGTVEGEVIADQAGEAYNISPSLFTIPGFQGSPKFEGFSAQSSQTFTGGGSGDSAALTVVAAVDREAAEQEAKEKAREMFVTETRSSLSPEEKLLEERIDIAPTANPIAPEPGIVADSFEYKRTYKVRAFVFSERAVREKLEQSSVEKLPTVRFRPVGSNITYSESVANFEDRTLRLRARAVVNLESAVDEEALKRALAGKKEAAIEQVVQDFPEVQKIRVVFWPSGISRSLPKAIERITIIMEPGEAIP